MFCAWSRASAAAVAVIALALAPALFADGEVGMAAVLRERPVFDRAEQAPVSGLEVGEVGEASVCAVTGEEGLDWVPAEWVRYENVRFGFALRLPPGTRLGLYDASRAQSLPPEEVARLEAMDLATTHYLLVGERMYVSIDEVDPLSCRGDCPVVEQVEEAEAGPCPALRAEGWLPPPFGPGRFRKLIVRRADPPAFIGLHVYGTEPPLDEAGRLPPPSAWPPVTGADAALFEAIAATLRLTR
jgi:hypothetical protein